MAESDEMWSAVEGHTLNSEIPGSNPLCCFIEAWAFSDSPRRPSSFSCINQYLAIDRVGVDYKSPITITVPIKLSIRITIIRNHPITIIRLQSSDYSYLSTMETILGFLYGMYTYMIERATVLRCENVNNQTFILHPGLSINREIRVFPRAVGNTGK